MSTVSTLPNGKGLVSVKGAPETIKTMLHTVPTGYDDTYKYFTRRGSRVLALAWKDIGSTSNEKVRKSLKRDGAFADFPSRSDQASPPRSSGERVNVCRIPGIPLSIESRRHRNTQDVG